MSKLVRSIHLSIFMLIIVGCLAEIITSGILIGDYNNLSEPDSFSSLAIRTKYLLFCGIWTAVFSFVYVLGLSIAPDHLLFSLASHLIWIGVTIVLFVSGSAALATEIKGQEFPHQERLEILRGFAWADCILLACALVIILTIGLGRRNGLTGNLLGGP